MFLELNRHNPESIAGIDDSGQSISYGKLLTFTDIYSAAIVKRSLIFILSENSIGSLAGYVAALSAEIVPLILSKSTDKDLLNRLIDLYKPSFIWSPEKLLDDKSFEKVFTQFNYCLLKTGFASPPLLDELSLLLPTSGSTGSPKLVRHSYQNIEQNAHNVASFFELSADCRPIAILPMHYTMGLSVITSHLYAGATILLVKNNLTDKAFWEFIKLHQATSFTGVPFSFEILHKLRFFRMDLPHLKLLTQGGGKLSPVLFKAFADYAESAGKKFIATYGQTEGTARMAFLPAEKATEKICSIGIAIPKGELWLIDEQGMVIHEANVEGQLVYCGPNVTLGYASSAEELTLGDQNNGILYTGDIAFRDNEGFYFIVGRLKRFLKIYGFRISLDEVEHLVKTHFDMDCLCSGTDDMLRILINEEEKLDAVQEYIVEKTGLFHQAITVEFINEIPKNESGKTKYN